MISFSWYKGDGCAKQNEKSAEANAVLKKIADLLLDENVKVTVETAYYELNKDNQVVLTKEPRIPSKLGSILRIGNQSVNVNRARSVKIDNFTMRRWPNGAGFYIITPEGKDYSFEGNLSSNIKPYHIYGLRHWLNATNGTRICFFSEESA